MLARDIMTRDVVTVKPDEEIEKVAQLLVENKISGIPVVDDDQHIVGIITEKDLIVRAGELKVPFYITLFDSIIFLENPIRFSNSLKQYTASKVGDAMTKEVWAVKEDEEVSKVVEIMQKKNINRVPVVRNGKLVGIISRNDVLKVLV
ncbi:MAG: CBS domain-containing protein [Syntrophomonadaceae bacterium]|nr:CBS domain-containing protein [Syntrophomonadaceae bacterium]